MKVNFNGLVELEIINGSKVERFTCLNLITNYGLSRFLGPKNIFDPVANVISIGFKPEDPSVTDIVVPGNYYTSDAIETKAEERRVSDGIFNVREDSQETVWEATFNYDDIPVGTSINHMHLGLRDENGVVHGLTSLKLRDRLTGEDIEYVHSELNVIKVTYKIVATLEVGTLTSNLNDVRLEGTVRTYPSNAIMRKELFYDSAYYDDNSTDPKAYIIPGTGERNEDGNWVQRHTLVTISGTRSSFVMEIGLLGMRFGRSSGNLTNSRHILEFIVSGLDPLHEVARPATAMRLHPNRGTSTAVEVLAPPNQWVYVYSGSDLLATGFSGAAGTCSFLRNDSELVAGKVLRIVTFTYNGREEVELLSPDLLAEDLVAIFWIDETTIRAVSNYMDSIELSRSINPYDTLQQIPFVVVNTGVCDAKLVEDERYYYCDIVVPDHNNHLNRSYNYKVTDQAGNVFTAYPSSDKSRALDNFVEGRTFIEASTMDATTNSTVTGTLDNVNTYNIVPRILSGVIK